MSILQGWFDERRNRHFALGTIPSFLCVGSTFLLCVYHVRAEGLLHRFAEINYTIRQTSNDNDYFKQYLQTILANLTTLDFILFGATIIAALETVNFITGHVGQWVDAKTVPVRGKHLDNFGFKDILFIGFSKASTAPFTYCYLKYAYEQPNIIWDPRQITVWNALLPIPALFIVFDFFYSIFHWFLHIQAIYPYIHKHHHQQKAPSRANIDAINVHPFEFLVGEFNHLLSLTLCSKFLFDQIHLVAALALIVTGGVLSGLSHTRYDFVVSMPWFGGRINLFDSKDHDVHHRIPQSNYGQYSMLWDRIFGTYRPYNQNDRINPRSQLDPKTGKTIGC